MKNLPGIGKLTDLVKNVKKELRRFNEQEIDLTVGWDNKTGGWTFQTGDNSFEGPVYGYPHWAVVTVTRSCKSYDLALAIRENLAELAYFECE